MVNFKNGELITALNTNDNELELLNPSGGSYNHFIAVIKIISSPNGIRFGVGEPTSNNSHLFGEGDTLLMSFTPSIMNLYFKATNINDSFVITV